MRRIISSVPNALFFVSTLTNHRDLEIFYLNFKTWSRYKKKNPPIPAILWSATSQLAPPQIILPDDLKASVLASSSNKSNQLSNWKCYLCAVSRLREDLLICVCMFACSSRHIKVIALQMLVKQYKTKKKWNAYSYVQLNRTSINI